jgi:hypothetical protein
MAKKKNKKETEATEAKAIEITAAAIKDDFCHYSFAILSGVGIGDKHNVKGSGIVDEDLKIAFARLNVHMAAIDDAFKSIDVDNIDKYHNSDQAHLYIVTGFEIKGSEENRQIILIGSKHINVGGRIEMKTPKILLEPGTSYKWYNELLEESNKCIAEVEEYRNGKCTPVEVETTNDPDQLSLVDQADEFENAKQ